MLTITSLHFIFYYSWSSLHGQFCLGLLCGFLFFFNLWTPRWLPEKERLPVLFCHVAETVENQNQVLLKFLWSSVHDQPPQKIWIIVFSLLGAVFTLLLFQDAIGVDDELTEARVESCFVPELAQIGQKLCVPLQEVKLIALVYHPCQRVSAHLQHRKKRSS